MSPPVVQFGLVPAHTRQRSASLPRIEAQQATPASLTSGGGARALVVAHPYAETVRLPDPVDACLAGRSPMFTSSVTAAFQALQRSEGHVDLAVVHLEGVDRFRDGWAGHRLIERLVRGGNAEVVAWVAADDRDGAAFAAMQGARVVTGPPRDRAFLGAGRSGERLAAWFRRRHHAPWEDWMEQACAALASAADRRVQARYCGQAWEVAPGAAQRRLRSLRAILCEETREHPGLERRLAIEVLRAIARERLIQAEPIVVRSVHVAARALRTSSDLASQLALTSIEASDVRDVADAETELMERVSNSSGRPTVDAWQLRRSQAVGRVASARSADRQASERERARILEHLERTLLTIHDAIEDGEA